MQKHVTWFSNAGQSQTSGHQHITKQTHYCVSAIVTAPTADAVQSCLHLQAHQLLFLVLITSKNPKP